MKKTVFIGSYTTPEAAGIRRAVIDTCEGTILPLPVVPGVGNPIYFAENKAKDRLYVAQGESPDAGRASGGTLAVYAVGADFGLKLLDSRRFDFSVPCHISLNPAGTKLLFAEYSLAHAGVLDLNADGTFAPGNGVVVHHEGRGPNAKRQESAHCHCAVASPDGATLFVCDLGTDTVNAYDLASPGLAPRPGLDFHALPGYGPRHLIFNAAGDRAYLVYELASAVQSFAFADGALKPLQEPLSMLPPGCACETKAAAIRLSPSGRWLLASNRGHDSVAAFRVADDGTLADAPAISKLTGSFPRDFDFVGGTDCVILGHKMSDNVGLYRFDEATGTLARLDATLEMPRPLAFI